MMMMMQMQQQHQLMMEQMLGTENTMPNTMQKQLLVFIQSND